MELRDVAGVGLAGRVRARTWDATGHLLRSTGWQRNVTTNGLAAAVAAWLANTPNRGQDPVRTPQYVMLGTGTGTPAVTDTALFAPVAATFVPVTVQRVASTPTVTEWVAVWGPTYGPVTATEVGLFTITETLMAHVLLDMGLTPGTTTSLQWQITVTPG